MHFCCPTEANEENVNNNNNDVLIPENVYFCSPFSTKGSLNDAVTCFHGAHQRPITIMSKNTTRPPLPTHSLKASRLWAYY